MKKTQCPLSKPAYAFFFFKYNNLLCGIVLVMFAFLFLSLSLSLFYSVCLVFASFTQPAFSREIFLATVLSWGFRLGVPASVRHLNYLN